MRQFICVIATCLVMAGLANCARVQPSPPVPSPPTGSFAVTNGFGAVTTIPYTCTGDGSVRISPVALSGTTGTAGPETKTFAYSGWSLSRSGEPACQHTAMFDNLRTGTWLATDGTSQCQVDVRGAELTTIKLWDCS